MVLARVVGLKGKYQTVGAVCLSTHHLLALQVEDLEPSASDPEYIFYLRVDYPHLYIHQVGPATVRDPELEPRPSGVRGHYGAVAEQDVSGRPS